MAKWTEADKIKALAIAEASSTQEAEKETGIPSATIRSWRLRAKGVATGMNATNATVATQRNAIPKKIEILSKEIIEEAKEQVREVVADRVQQVANGLLDLVEAARAEAQSLIESGLDPDDTKSQWLKAVIGAIAQGTEKHQLFMGKPTTRQEVNGEVKTVHEQHYHITQELIANRPELADELIGRGMVGRGVTRQP